MTVVSKACKKLLKKVVVAKLPAAFKAPLKVSASTSTTAKTSSSAARKADDSKLRGTWTGNEKKLFLKTAKSFGLPPDESSTASGVAAFFHKEKSAAAAGAGAAAGASATAASNGSAEREDLSVFTWERFMEHGKLRLCSKSMRSYGLMFCVCVSVCDV
jgi:hypothetical protein